MCNRRVQSGFDIFHPFSWGPQCLSASPLCLPSHPSVLPGGPLHSQSIWAVPSVYRRLLPASICHQGLHKAGFHLPLHLPSVGGTMFFRPQNSCLKSVLTSHCLLAQKSFPRGAEVQKRDRWSLSFYNTASLLKRRAINTSFAFSRCIVGTTSVTLCSSATVSSVNWGGA